MLSRMKKVNFLNESCVVLLIRFLVLVLSFLGYKESSLMNLTMKSFVYRENKSKHSTLSLKA